jgi:NADPH:quinone reductase-like Zn-dependent oxidoreductase
MTVRTRQSPPSMMKAAAIDRFGPPTVLKLHTLPTPRAGRHEVLIALSGAGVGVWDLDVRDGSLRPGGRPTFPLTPGMDGAGIVVAKGAGVGRLRLGDRVWAVDYASPHGGFYAQYIAVNAGLVGRVPQNLDLRQAAASAVTGLTALRGVADVLRIRRGETVLIFGASGAVGTLAIQFAKQRGARVIATASGSRAATLVRRLGADAVIDARKKTSIERLGALAPDGLDAVLAFAGGPALERCLDFLRRAGRVVFPNGIEPPPRRRPRVRRRAFDAVLGSRRLASIARAATAAQLKVPIAAVSPLERAAKAHARLARGPVAGRIVLRIGRAV